MIKLYYIICNIMEMFFRQFPYKKETHMILATIPRIGKFLSDEPNPFENRYFFFEQYRRIFDELRIPLVTISNTWGSDKICDFCDGLILPGSQMDTFPSYYGREPLEGKVYEVDEYKDDREIVKLFVDAGKPVFGICGGLQTLNVYFGGTLKQRIAGHDNVNHQIKIKEGSFLHSVFESTDAVINSWHSQAIDDLAPGFEVTAVAPDGTIEAIEKGNIVAFQWHPEIMLDVKLFRKFTERFF